MPHATLQPCSYARGARRPSDLTDGFRPVFGHLSDESCDRRYLQRINSGPVSPGFPASRPAKRGASVRSTVGRRTCPTRAASERLESAGRRRVDQHAGAAAHLELRESDTVLVSGPRVLTRRYVDVEHAAVFAGLGQRAIRAYARVEVDRAVLRR